MSLLRALTNLGIPPSDASQLDNCYANVDEADFLDGLEIVARAIASKSLQTISPQSEPWQSIHAAMLITGQAEQAFFDCLTQFDPALQISLAQVVSSRVNEIRQFQQQINQANGKRKKSGDYLKILKHLGYSFKYNLCTQSIEVNNDKITDAIAQTIRKQMRDAGAWEIAAVEDVYGSEAYEHRYHPIRDYLSSLKFEGGDPIADLAGYFTDAYQIFPTWLRRWLVGAVARAHGAHQNRMLVLEGPQNIGKSKFVQWLGSPLPEYYYEGAIAPDDKDCRLRLLYVWIWEVNELGSTMRRTDREHLKAFLTTEIVRERKPYGKYDIIGPAVASFIGTVNNESGILSDPTGSRRFMITHLSKIDWRGYTKQIDVDQVWAQAYELYLHDEPWDLTDDERKQAEEINENYQVIDLVEETIKKIFSITKDPQDWLSTVEIMNVLKDEYQGNLKGAEIDTRKLAAALTRIGLEKPTSRKVRGQVIRGYFGIKIGP